MKQIDYESILCGEFGCNRLMLDIIVYGERKHIVDAMKEAVRQALENYEYEN